MIEIKDTDIPDGCANCYNCGCTTGLKSILVYQTASEHGKIKRIPNTVTELRLCQKCMKEMGELLINQK